MAKTNISWTATRRPDGTLAQGYSFNPWIGCTKVSEGCKNCYAAENFRFKQHFGPTAERHVTSENYWKQPLKWNKKAEAEGVRYKVFCGSMCDVFEFFNYADGEMERKEADKARDRLWVMIEKTPHLDWLLLTKRPEMSWPLMPVMWRDRLPDNVWIGVSVENQEQADTRIPELLRIPATVRFLSCEPLLGEIISKVEQMKDVDWIIVGGESGSNRREMDVFNMIGLYLHCRDNSIPFFCKQDSAQKPGQQGRIPDWLWDIKQFPNE